MPNLKAVVFVIFMFPVIAFSQSRQPTLTNINENYLSEQSQSEVRILNYLKANPQERILNLKNGGVRLLVDVSESGIPIYKKSFNATEAITIGVPALRTGGSLGINILGTGIVLGTWDGGRVLSSHVELVGRVTQKDGATAISDHATHTSGTMIASGVNAEAKGMAPEATLIAYDFANDISEMTAQAKPNQTSLLLSNHSYGTVCGWDFSTGSWVWQGDPNVDATQDYKFGFYTSESAQLDGIAFNAPYYTIVKAAGNDRGDYNGTGPQIKDGGNLGYDCLPTAAGSKNILTVGAVTTAGAMSSFSSWGPTDDGRIKPDLVAPGVNVISSWTDSNSSYKAESGTSMATPMTTGTLALLQQLYKSLNSGNYMRSATLKALVLHSVKEAGNNPGPDYSFGWGLLDAAAAAKLIINKDNQNVFINEQVLTSGQTFEMDLGVPKLGTKITATIVWTDPAGTPPALALNPRTKMLVNDLDMRLVDAGGNAVRFPWTLAYATPAAAALNTADNSTDNVEKIEFSNTTNVGYKIRINNKGTLVGGSQAFSLILEYSSTIDPRTTYYWRPLSITTPVALTSGGGKWTDGTHWSLSSGGPAANATPGPNDRVVFDENSFVGDTDTISVKLPSSTSVYSIRWFAKEAADLSFGGNTLTVAESMTLLASKITTSTSGIINFTGTGSNSNSVDLGSSKLDKWTLQFNGNSAWSVTGTSSLDKISMLQGAVTLNGSAIGVNQLSSSGALTKSLNFVSASLQAVTSMSIDFTGIPVTSDILSSIVALPGVTNTLNLSSIDFKGFVNVSNGDISITGTNKLQSIQGNGIVRLNGSFIISSLTLSGGSQIILQQGTTHTFTDKIALSTTSVSRVKILSSGTNATIAFTDYFKICLDFVDVTNVDVTGTSIVSAGTGGTVTNSANWLKVSCSSIVFPDFSISYSCVKSSTYFTDKSSGTITSRVWSFGDPASGNDNTSTLASPLHYFIGAGPFTVTLTVTGSSGSRSVAKTVTLIPNDLADNTIQVSNGSLISTVLANSYQWLKDGQVIPSATNRTYGAVASGIYSVLTFSTTCNKRSALFVATAVEDEAAPVSTSIKIYPIPTSDVLQIESVNNVIRTSIMDAVGREISIDAEPLEAGRYRLNLSSIPSGLYILKTTTDKKVDLQKIIIRK